MHLPSNPLQPGPIYFLSPRKCGIFGVCCEGIPLQLNYLTDESVDCGKGSNTVVSLLHDFLSTTTIKANHLNIHADNCVGQNKNNTLLQVIEIIILITSVNIVVVYYVVFPLES